MPFDKQYWDSRYINKETGWDIGFPSTALVQYIDQLDDKNIAILIPGGGNSYEAGYLLQKGFTNVTVADISAIVCENLKERYATYIDKGLTVLPVDFFELTDRYDLILEQTFFCAICPLLRRSYVDKMYELLQPKGKLAGVLFNCSFEDGPPFGGSEEEYRGLFGNRFMIKIMSPCHNSIAPRVGTELFICMQPINVHR